MKPLLEGKELFDLLPQKQPMNMVHALLAYKHDSATSSLTILPDNLFIENNKLSLAGLVENIAQTIACRSAFQFLTNKDVSSEFPNPPVGFIGAITKLNFLQSPPIGAEIQTTIKVEAEMMDISLVSGETWWNGVLLLSCSMKVFVRK